MIIINAALKNLLIGTIGIAIGLLSIFSGSSVLFGFNEPDYHVLTWLVIYNVGMGFVSVAAGIGIWSGQLWGRQLSFIIASAHGAILATLLVFFALNLPVAAESIGAMSFRAAIWLTITLLVRK